MQALRAEEAPCGRTAAHPGGRSHSSHGSNPKPTSARSLNLPSRLIRYCLTDGEEPSRATRECTEEVDHRRIIPPIVKSNLHSGWPRSTASSPLLFEIEFPVSKLEKLHVRSHSVCSHRWRLCHRALCCCRYAGQRAGIHQPRKRRSRRSTRPSSNLARSSPVSAPP